MSNYPSSQVRRDLDNHSEARHNDDSANPPVPPKQEDVSRILRARRARNTFFDAELFADPAWDMLLELYAAELGQHKISVSSLCVGSNVPATTALRWIQTLEKQHLLKRVADPLDGRRVFVSLTVKGSRAMTAYFQALKSRPRSQVC